MDNNAPIGCDLHPLNPENNLIPEVEVDVDVIQIISTRTSVKVREDYINSDLEEAIKTQIELPVPDNWVREELLFSES